MNRITWLIAYIHQNPQRYGLSAGFRAWEYTSYQAIVFGQPAGLKWEEVLARFDGPSGLTIFHEQQAPFPVSTPWYPAILPRPGPVTSKQCG